MSTPGPVQALNIYTLPYTQKTWKVRCARFPEVASALAATTVVLVTIAAVMAAIAALLFWAVAEHREKCVLYRSREDAVFQVDILRMPMFGIPLEKRLVFYGNHKIADANINIKPIHCVASSKKQIMFVYI